MSILDVFDSANDVTTTSNREVIVFLHDFAFDRSMWQHSISACEQSYRCIAVNFTGKSSVSSIVTDLKRLLNEKALDQVILVGQGLGGILAVELALLSPALVKRMVLIGTFVGYEPQVTHKRYTDEISALTSGALAAEDFFHTWSTRLFSAQFIEQHSEDVASIKAQWQHSQDEFVANLNLWINRRDAAEELDKLALATYLITGSVDKIHPVLESYLMLDCIDGSQLEVVADRGHACTVEAPEKVSQLLVDFLSRH